MMKGLNQRFFLHTEALKYISRGSDLILLTVITPITISSAVRSDTTLSGFADPDQSVFVLLIQHFFSIKVLLYQMYNFLAKNRYLRYRYHFLLQVRLFIDILIANFCGTVPGTIGYLPIVFTTRPVPAYFVSSVIILIPSTNCCIIPVLRIRIRMFLAFRIR
jgi:hypothetical protein